MVTTLETAFGTGQREESYINLYWYNSRWYDPALGRWLSPDTVIPAQQGVMGNDRYAYTNNNAVRYTDPSGHYGKEVHYYMTYQIMYDAVLLTAQDAGYSEHRAMALATNMAKEVASADQGVDEGGLLGPDSSLWANTPHWESHDQASTDIKSGVEVANTQTFGRGLHSLQDYYSHAGLGFNYGGPGKTLFLEFADDKITMDGNVLTSPVHPFFKFVNSLAIGHLEPSTILSYVVDDWLGITPNFDYPDRYDSNNSWDELMAGETEYWSLQFATTYFEDAN